MGVPALPECQAAPRFCRLTPGIARELVSHVISVFVTRNPQSANGAAPAAAVAGWLSCGSWCNENSSTQTLVDAHSTMIASSPGQIRAQDTRHGVRTTSSPCQCLLFAE